jgi:hypothetical protein
MSHYDVPHAIRAIAFTLLLACNQMERSESVKPNVDLTESESDRLTTSADRAARSLGYKPETMNLILAKEGDIYTVYYFPTGRAKLGGGLFVYLNEKGDVIKYLHAP